MYARMHVYMYVYTTFKWLPFFNNVAVSHITSGITPLDSSRAVV